MLLLCVQSLLNEDQPVVVYIWFSLSSTTQEFPPGCLQFRVWGVGEKRQEPILDLTHIHCLVYHHEGQLTVICLLLDSVLKLPSVKLALY